MQYVLMITLYIIKFILLQNVSKDLKITDESGKEMNAFKVFVSAIKYLRDFVLNEMEKGGILNLTTHEINWVITVPAIWSNGSKQFMREAATAVSFFIGDIYLY